MLDILFPIPTKATTKWSLLQNAKTKTPMKLQSSTQIVLWKTFRVLTLNFQSTLQKQQSIFKKWLISLNALKQRVTPILLTTGSILMFKNLKNMVLFLGKTFQLLGLTELTKTNKNTTLSISRFGNLFQRNILWNGTALGSWLPWLAHWMLGNGRKISWKLNRHPHRRDWP